MIRTWGVKKQPCHAATEPTLQWQSGAKYLRGFLFVMPDSQAIVDFGPH